MFFNIIAADSEKSTKSKSSNTNCEKSLFVEHRVFLRNKHHKTKDKD